jgi:hypothetical protein
MADLDHARLRIDRNDVEDSGRRERADAGLDEGAAVKAAIAYSIPAHGGSFGGS